MFSQTEKKMNRVTRKIISIIYIFSVIVLLLSHRKKSLTKQKLLDKERNNTFLSSLSWPIFLTIQQDSIDFTDYICIELHSMLSQM